MEQKSLIEFYKKLHKLLPNRFNLGNYVILKEDEKGQYIEYAFKDGAPENNRCLSWYNSIQLETYKRNGWDEESIAYRIQRIKEGIGKVYSLSKMTCGEDDNLDPDRRCIPGAAAPRCIREGRAGKNWTPEQPCKCGCWYLDPPAGKTIEEFLNECRFSLTLEDIKNLLENDGL